MSRYRRDLNEKKDKAVFSRTADRTHYMNLMRPRHRGGIRL